MMATRLPALCARGCGRTMTKTDDWVIGHKKSRHAYPQLTWDVNNWQIECRECSNKSGNEAIIEKAKLDALTEAGFSLEPTGSEVPARPVSPPRTMDLTRWPCPASSR